MMMGLSSYLFGVAFFCYVVTALFYIARITLRRRDRKYHEIADKLGDLAFKLCTLGVTLHGGAIGARWIASDQVPLSNMFEYMSFVGWSVMFMFILISFWYKLPALGAFVAPVGVIMIAYASVFPTEVKPLVPVLQSYWLPLHVSTAALGEGAFAVSFGAALMYLLRVRGEKSSPAEERTLEFFFYLMAALVGFLVLALGFKFTGYQVELQNGASGMPLQYQLPPFFGPLGAKAGATSWLGIPLPLVTVPSWMEGAGAAKKLNTLVLSLVAGFVVYGLLRLIAKGPVRELGSRAVAGMNPNLLDEVSYRGVAVGFPIFTMGAIVFAMIWAQKAWGSYWSWDPKETWALISWLFYSGYLHMRIVRGWEGKAAAWVSVIGFVLVIFTLVGVNLLISGLHSYA